MPSPLLVVVVVPPSLSLSDPTLVGELAVACLLPFDSRAQRARMSACMAATSAWFPASSSSARICALCLVTWGAPLPPFRSPVTIFDLLAGLLRLVGLAATLRVFLWQQQF